MKEQNDELNDKIQQVRSEIKRKSNIVDELQDKINEERIKTPLQSGTASQLQTERK